MVESQATQRPAVILPTLAHSRHRGVFAASHCTKLREGDPKSEHEHDSAEMRHVSGP